MKITIFGIGRSGTKAIQLYTAYYVAKKYQKVRIVYEPFFMHSRKKGSENSFAYRVHSTAPIVNAENSSSLNNLINSFNFNDEIATVYKFIRGNGRIDMINDTLKPDLSILVVRDLYEVLASIAVQTWNMEDRWNKIQSELIKFYPEAEYLTHPNKLMRHAAYWYCLNKYSLENSKTINYFLNFSKADKMKDILNDNNLEADKQISERIFTGENIHYDYPLKDITEIKTSAPDKLKMLLGSGFGQIGTISVINDLTSENTTEKGPRVTVEQNELFNRFNKEIFELLENKI
ncbi:MAG: hypothetical protein KDC67_15985 [Ignavibacteriae bacterium]|nr:hypothetical protein [Ignavibacteriota bacterium]